MKQRPLCYEVTFRQTGGDVEGYIFRGARGQEPPNPNKPAVTLFASPQSSPAAGCVNGVAKKKLKRLKNKPRRFHVVLVNQSYPNGAVRGQVKRADRTPGHPGFHGPRRPASAGPSAYRAHCPGDPQPRLRDQRRGGGLGHGMLSACSSRWR